MEKNNSFSFTARIKSFKYALSGMVTLLKTEHNARVHVVAGLGVIFTGLSFDLSPLEWSLIVLCIVLVLAGEALNAAIEYLANYVQPEYEPMIGKAKDLGAAAVLFLALGAAIVAAFIFIPKLLLLF